jgi:uncharacterized protein
MNVALIGASDRAGKYSNMAFHMLKEAGHQIFPVHPKLSQIEGVKVYPSIDLVPEPIDVVTLYVGRRLSSEIGNQIIQKKPGRLIFNPGAENLELLEQAKKRGIDAFEACTLTMLRTGQF